MKKSLKFGIGISIVMIIIGGSLIVASLNSNSKTNQTNEVRQPTQSEKSETNAEKEVKLNETNMGTSDENSENAEKSKSMTPNNPQGSIIEGNTNDRISKVNFDRTNNTEAAKVAKAYYQSIGQDSDTLAYNGYPKGDGYEVRVVDTSIQKQGGSGTVELLTVDKDNNVSHVN